MTLRRSWLWWLLLAALLLGIARVRFDVEILNLLPQRLSVVQGLKLYQQHFSDARELVVAVEAPTAEGAERTARLLAESLRAHSNLIADVIWRPPWLEAPGQSAELLAFLWLNQPPERFAQLARRLAPTNLATVLQATREQLATSLSAGDLALSAYDPYGIASLPESVANAAPGMGRGEDVFVSNEGTFRVLFVEANRDLTSYRACRSWLAEVRQIVERLQPELPVGVRIGWTGRPAFATEIADSMERDMSGPAAGTLAVIALLFWLTHRRIIPLLWLVVLLITVLAGTTALGGLVFGTINVVSIGFAAILLGLAEDFGIVVYQESRTHPELDQGALRRLAAPGILWSALTTGSAFLLLNLSALPGLGQLGSLVAIGLGLAVVVMLYAYLPLLRRAYSRTGPRHAPSLPAGDALTLFPCRKVLPRPLLQGLALVLFIVSLAVVWWGGIRLDNSPDVLKPKNSQAGATMDLIQSHLGGEEEALWVFVSGNDEREVGERLERAEHFLGQAFTNGLVSRMALPTTLWPEPEHQRANGEAAAAILKDRKTLRSAALNAGFTEDALMLTEGVLGVWQHAIESPGVFWPTNRASQWVLDKVSARSKAGMLALGLVHPGPQGALPLAQQWPEDLEQDGILLSGWPLLGPAVFDMVVKELPRVLWPVFVLVLVSLWLAFGSFRQAALSLATVGFSGLLLAASMNSLGWRWNLLNLMALPLLLGMAVDFSIHMQLALRRSQGDRLRAHGSMGRALLLAGTTTAAGFASLAFSTNAGMASLGKVCALGIALALLTAVYLLPAWWKYGPSAHQASPVPADTKKDQMQACQKASSA